MTRRSLEPGPAAIATLQSDIPDDMTLAEYRRIVSGRAGRRRRRRRWGRVR